MKANFLDFRKRMKHIIKSLELNEPVTVFYRGREKGVIYPAGMAAKKGEISVSEHPSFGIWKKRKEFTDPAGYVRKIRKLRRVI